MNFRCVFWDRCNRLRLHSWHVYLNSTVIDQLYYYHTIGLLSIQIDKYETYCIAQPVLHENKPKIFTIQSCKCENRCINGTLCFQVKIIFITCESLLRPKMFTMLSLTIQANANLNTKLYWTNVLSDLRSIH